MSPNPCGLVASSWRATPPTGAKGLNLAVADVFVLTRALGSYYRTGDTGGLEAYSEMCLKRVWRAQGFSSWLTTLLHRADPDAYTYRLQLAQLEGLVRSDAAARAFAEAYVGAF